MLSIVVWICSCGFNKAFSGEVKEIHGDTVCIPSKCFKLFPNAPKTKVGNKAVFKTTRDKRKSTTKMVCA